MNCLTGIATVNSVIKQLDPAPRPVDIPDSGPDRHESGSVEDTEEERYSIILMLE